MKNIWYFEKTITDDNDMCFRNTGIKRDEYLEISDNLETIRNTFQRTKNQALAVYLFWQVWEVFIVQLVKENLNGT